MASSSLPPSSMTSAVTPSRWATYGTPDVFRFCLRWSSCANARASPNRSEYTPSRYSIRMRRALALLFVPVLMSAADYDVVIRNARVIDGSGNPWYRADVALKDGRIAAIGRLTDVA